MRLWRKEIFPMGTESGGYSYIEMNRKRNVKVSLTPEAVVRLVASRDLDPTSAAEALRVAEKERIEEAIRAERAQGNNQAKHA